MEHERKIGEGCMEEVALKLLLEYGSFSTGREVEMGEGRRKTFQVKRMA